MPPYSILMFGFLLKHYVHGHEEFGGWRSPQDSAIESVMQTGKSPLHWPTVMYEENEVTHQRVPEMAVMVYAITTLYYQVMGKYSIKRTPDEKKRPYRGFDWQKRKEDFIKEHEEKYLQELSK